jgi:hypothetical protein
VRLPADTHYDDTNGTLTVRLPPAAPVSTVEVTLDSSSGSLQRHDDATRPLLAKLLTALRCGSEAKRGLSLRLDEILADFEALGAYRTALSDTQLRALLEVLVGSRDARLREQRRGLCRRLEQPRGSPSQPYAGRSRTAGPGIRNDVSDRSTARLRTSRAIPWRSPPAMGRSASRWPTAHCCW